MKSDKTAPVDGPHKELFADGGLSGEGRLKAGKRHGKWTFYYKNVGIKAVGKYIDGELDGYWEWWRENGRQLQAGAFACGKQVGWWRRFYESGQPWDEGEYANGMKIGEWKVYEKTGALKNSKTFKPKTSLAMPTKPSPRGSTTRTSPATTVDAYMKALEHPHKASIQELRELVLSVDPRIKEQVKWNAPSFYLEDNFATLRVQPEPILQLVLHSGSKRNAHPKKFELLDPQSLLKWPAKDRCVVTFSSSIEVSQHKAAIKRMITDWIRQL
ncbi:MAG: DUF1801 domain-containing protein [Proteobacteria bacterium]|nr:DUF1801 domain-containing protein [Pseudomonadota bacterium]